MQILSNPSPGFDQCGIGDTHHQPRPLSDSLISHGLNDQRERGFGFIRSEQVFTVCSSKVWPCRGFWCLQHVRSRRRSVWFTLTVIADPVANPLPPPPTTITPVQNPKSGLWKSLRCLRKPEPGPTGKWPWITRPPSLPLQKKNRRVWNPKRRVIQMCSKCHRQ